MSKHHRSKTQKSSSADDFAKGKYSSVFIDTNLDTHLATVVSHSDTVSDLKAKISLEHLHCFPKIGEIKIHGLKVKRRGNFYNLSESMLVSSAFEANKNDLFISVDASCVAKPLALVQFQPNHSDESSSKKIGCTHCTSPKPVDSHISALKESQDVNILKDQGASTKSAVVAATDACNNTEMEDNVVSYPILDSVSAEQKEKRKLDVPESGEIPLHYKRRKFDDEDRLSNEDVEPEDSSKEKPVQEIVEMKTVTPPLAGSDMRENDADIEVAAGESQFDVDDRFGAEQVSEQKAAAHGSSSVAVIEDTVIEHLPEAEPVPLESVKVRETKKGKEKRVRKSGACISESATNSVINDGLSKKDESFLSRIEDVADASLQQNPVDSSHIELNSMTERPEIDSLPHNKNDVDIGEKLEGIFDGATAASSKKSKSKKKVKKVLVSSQDLHEANDSAGGIAFPVDDHLNVEPASKQVSKQKQVDGSSFVAVKENEDLPQDHHDKNIENREALVVLAEPVEVLKSEVGEPKKKKKKRILKVADVICQTANNGDSVDVMKKDENYVLPSDTDLKQNPVDTSHMASDKEISTMNEPNSNTSVAVDEKSCKKLNENKKVEDAVDVVSKPKRKPVKKQKSGRSNLPTNDEPVHQSTVSDEKKKKLKTDKNRIDFKNYFVSAEKDKKVISEVKNSRLKPEKSLLLTPPTIFGEDSSSDSSGAKKKSGNARRNIPTPSSSSGSSMDSVKNDRKEGGKKNKIPPKSTGPTGLTLDMIMRNSSTFKKAKRTQVEDSESQPMEFVPDSQPDS